MPSPKLVPVLLSLAGLVFNAALSLRLVTLSVPFKWDLDSEWETSASPWRMDGVKLVWVLLSAYFATSSIACLFGLAGVLKGIPTYVRLYRDYAIVDLCFSTLSIVTLAFSSFHPTIRASLCEELSRQPELLRDFADAGLDLENCEQWFEHVVAAFIALAAVVLIIRLHFTVVVSSYYKRLLRQHTAQRVFLLPSRSSPHPRSKSSDSVLVYAAVPYSSLSEEDALQLDATEAWVSPIRSTFSPIASPTSSPYRGQIRLPILVNEGLLPSYDLEHEIHDKSRA